MVILKKNVYRRDGDNDDSKTVSEDKTSKSFKPVKVAKTCKAAAGKTTAHGLFTFVRTFPTNVRPYSTIVRPFFPTGPFITDVTLIGTFAANRQFIPSVAYKNVDPLLGVDPFLYEPNRIITELPLTRPLFENNSFLTRCCCKTSTLPIPKMVHTEKNLQQLLLEAPCQQPKLQHQLQPKVQHQQQQPQEPFTCIICCSCCKCCAVIKYIFIDIFLLQYYFNFNIKQAKTKSKIDENQEQWENSRNQKKRKCEKESTTEEAKAKAEEAKAEEEKENENYPLFCSCVDSDESLPHDENINDCSLYCI